MKALKSELFDRIRKDPLGKEALKSFISSGDDRKDIKLSSGKEYIIVSTDSKEFEDYQIKKLNKMT
ncbi:UNVERIFIED_ORG: hypothetical protein M2402_004881 [Rahnella aquatilis]